MTVLEIMFQYLYPRLDAQVSMHLNHLLKSPFCVHPKTGRVCVPIRARDCQKFNPMDVPTVMDLCRQINQYDKKHPDQVDAEGKRIPGNERNTLYYTVNHIYFKIGKKRK